jgi:hypothetical protein
MTDEQMCEAVVDGLSVCHQPTCSPDYPEKPAGEEPQHLIVEDIGDGEFVLQCSDCGAFGLRPSTTASAIRASARRSRRRIRAWRRSADRDHERIRVMNGFDLDTRTRKILAAVTPETVLSACHELVALGFPARTAFALVCAVLEHRQA